MRQRGVKMYLARDIRVFSLCAALLAPVFFTACWGDDAKQKGGAGTEDITIVVEQDKTKIQQQEQDLTTKRQDVQREQEDLRKTREELRARLNSLTDKDRQQREKLEAEEQRLERHETELRTRQQSLELERDKLEKQKNELLNTIAQLTTKRSGGLTIEEREQAIARREERVARREGDLATREKQVTDQLAAIAKLLEELKSVTAGMGKTVVMTSSGGGGDQGPATQKSVQRKYTRVRAVMNKKGILDADLPERGRGLFTQYEDALKEKDYEAANEAVDSVSAIVDGITVDASFIQQKFNRVNALAAGKKMGTEIEKLLAEVTAAFTNGNYVDANAKLNQIYKKLKA
jgi:DNA repair exonuclease SbcCD ATPase subunit